MIGREEKGELAKHIQRAAATSKDKKEHSGEKKKEKRKKERKKDMTVEKTRIERETIHLRTCWMVRLRTKVSIRRRRRDLL